MAIDDNTLYGLTGAQVKELPGKIEAVKGLARKLTAADYNWNNNTSTTTDPNSVGLWMLAPGLYTWDSDTRVVYRSGMGTSGLAGAAIISEKNAAGRVPIILINTSGQFKQIAVNGSTGAIITDYDILNTNYIIDNLTSTLTNAALSANQGKVLKDFIDSIAIRGAGAPTTSTVGEVGQLYEDTTNGKLYQCTNVSGATYTWTEITKTDIKSTIGRGQTGGEQVEDLSSLWLAGKPTNQMPYALMTDYNSYDKRWSYTKVNPDTSGSINSVYAGYYLYDYQEDYWGGGEARLALYSDLDERVKQNAGAPTTSTVGTVGQLLEDTTNGDLYICTDATNPYVWEEVGSGGGGSSTTIQTTTDGDNYSDVPSLTLAGSNSVNFPYAYPIRRDGNVQEWGYIRPVIGLQNIISAYVGGYEYDGDEYTWSGKQETRLALYSDVHDATLTIQQNGATVDTFSANASTNKTVNIETPATFTTNEWNALWA